MSRNLLIHSKYFEARKKLVAVMFFLLVLPICFLAIASDHGDVPDFDKAPFNRSDAQITDFFVFKRDETLVVALCVNPKVLVSSSSYVFAPDIAFEFFFDNHSSIKATSELPYANLGGQIEEPAKVLADKQIRVEFEQNNPKLTGSGLNESDLAEIKVFTGLRDDPFIRKPRMGFNVGAIVMEIPLRLLQGRNDDLLCWATTSVDFPDSNGGPVVRKSDLAGRSFRSMFNDWMNGLQPHEHWTMRATLPDVVILDLSRPSGFPNGRLLTDDVLDLAKDLPPNALPGEGPEFPTTNDRSFLETFPYLAEPHPPR